MRQFASPAMRLWRLPAGARVLYSVFLGLTAAALVVSALLYQDSAGPSVATAARYYAGGDGGDGAATSTTDQGPRIDLPDGAIEVHMPKPYRFLLERTHQHLFMMPMLFLVLAHLFLMAGLSPKLTASAITGAGIAIPMHIAAPWLIRYAGTGWAWLMPVSGALLGLTMGFMTAASLWRLWRPPAGDVPAASGEAPT